MSYASAEEFLEALPENAVGCVLLDLTLPGKNGLEVMHELEKKHIALPVILLTGHADVPLAVKAVRGGAFDVIEKPFKDKPLVERVKQALALSAEVAQHPGRAQEHRHAHRQADPSRTPGDGIAGFRHEKQGDRRGTGHQPQDARHPPLQGDGQDGSPHRRRPGALELFGQSQAAGGHDAGQGIGPGVIHRLAVLTTAISRAATVRERITISPLPNGRGSFVLEQAEFGTIFPSIASNSRSRQFRLTALLATT